MDFIEVNGTALRYELRGSGARTVVLLHEMGGALESCMLIKEDPENHGFGKAALGKRSVELILVPLADAGQLGGEYRTWLQRP